MSGGTPGTTQVNQGAGTRDPGYGAARDFYNSLLGISQQPYPNQYPGQLDPGMSPSMQNAIRMGQGYASSGPPSIMGAAQGSLGQFMSPNFQNPFARIFGEGGGAPNYFGGNNSSMFNNSSQGSMGFLGSNPFMNLGGGQGQTPPWMSQEPYNVPGSGPAPGQPAAGDAAGTGGMPPGIDPTQVQSILDAMMKMNGGSPAMPPPTGTPYNPDATTPGTQFPLNPGAGQNPDQPPVTGTPYGPGATPPPMPQTPGPSPMVPGEPSQGGRLNGGGPIPYEPPWNGPNVGYPGMPGYDGKTPMDQSVIDAWVNQQRGGRTSPFAPSPSGGTPGTQFPLNPGAPGVSGAWPGPRPPRQPGTGGGGTPWQPGGGVSATRPGRRPRPLPTWAPKPLPPPAPAPVQPKPMGGG